MKNSIAVLVSHLPENIAIDCAVSVVLVVGCTVIGFLSRAIVLDLQTTVLILT